MASGKLILIIPNLGTGGAQAVFRQQLAFFSKHIPTIGVVFNRDNFSTADAGLDNVISLDVGAGATWLTKFGRFMERIRKLRAIKKQYGITISISHLEGADYINILSRESEKV